ncbi:MAG TPA: T9SS type A sorting domain-containing protein [Ignavibacteria bacterium]
MRKLKIILAFFLLLFITRYSLFITNCIAQWYPLPVFPTYLETSDVKFFDENTGILLLNNVTNTNPGILRTTNGGLNWTQIKSCYTYGNQKIDTMTMYIVTRLNGYNFIYRTFNKGLSWDSVSVNFLDPVFNYLSFVNKDTGWVTGFDGANYLIWRTTNGGLTLNPQSADAARGQLFFYDKKVNGEYVGWVNNVSALWKTTNSGNNWFQVSCPGTELYQITFINENTGWVSNGQAGMFKTINGGSNWVNQPLAPGIPNVTRSISRFCVFDSINLIGINGYKLYPLRGTALVWKTTNGGNIWGYQEIDSSYHIGFLASMDFINPNTGWAFEGNGVKTTNGGGIFTGILQKETYVSNYKLFQNYPNPFNPSTTIKFTLPRFGFVTLKVYNSIGKEIVTLISKSLSAGEYIVNFDAKGLSSGLYFYKISTDNFNDTKKMLLIK